MFNNQGRCSENAGAYVLIIFKITVEKGPFVSFAAAARPARINPWAYNGGCSQVAR